MSGLTARCLNPRGGEALRDLIHPVEARKMLTTEMSLTVCLGHLITNFLQRYNIFSHITSVNFIHYCFKDVTKFYLQYNTFKIQYAIIKEIYESEKGSYFLDKIMKKASDTTIKNKKLLKNRKAVVPGSKTNSRTASKQAKVKPSPISGVAPPADKQFGQPGGNKRNNGHWKSEDSISFQYNKLLRMNNEQFDKFRKQKDLTKAQQIAIKRILDADIASDTSGLALRTTIELTNRTEGDTKKELKLKIEKDKELSDEELEQAIFG